MAFTNLAKASNSLLTSGEVNRLLSDDGSGFFGLGTTSPSNVLHLSGNVQDTFGLAQTAFATTLRLRMYIGDGSTNGTVSAGGYIDLDGGNLNFRNSGTTNIDNFTLLPDGKISTGGESAPDCSPWGITLQQNTEDGNVLTFKSTDVAHGITGIAETDTYMFTSKAGATSGGLGLSALTTLTTSLLIDGYATTVDTTDTSSSFGNISIRTWLKSGTSTAVMASGANMFTVHNNNTTRFLIKGNGDIHATNATITALDEEDDIQLVQDLRYVTGGEAYKHKVTEKGMDSLIKHKVLSSEGNFQILQNVNALNLGAVGQLWNMIKGLGERLGLEEHELKQLAKVY